jgi:hypothetical protein
MELNRLGLSEKMAKASVKQTPTFGIFTNPALSKFLDLKGSRR